jgi:hypothetical protein
MTDDMYELGSGYRVVHASNTRVNLVGQIFVDALQTGYSLTEDLVLTRIAPRVAERFILCF